MSFCALLTVYGPAHGLSFIISHHFAIVYCNCSLDLGRLSCFAPCHVCICYAVRTVLCITISPSPRQEQRGHRMKWSAHAPCSEPHFMDRCHSPILWIDVMVLHLLGLCLKTNPFRPAGRYFVEGLELFVLSLMSRSFRVSGTRLHLQAML